MGTKEVTTQPQLPATIKAKFNIALLESKFQELENRKSALVFNEDNIEEIKKFLTDIRQGEMKVEAVHKVGKEPSLLEGRNWDLGKNTTLGLYAVIKNEVQPKFEKLCKDIEQKRIDAARETIKNGIETNALNFASRIANCKTSEELTNLERQINLEKGRKDKYQEFADNAVERYNQLNSLLAEQKIEVRKLEKLEQERIEAEKQKDDEKLLQIAEQKEVLETKIEEQKIVVQETAINQSLQDQFELAEVLLPTIKAKRTTIEYEVVDIKETLKDKPDWVILTPNKDVLNEYTKFLKETSTTDVDVVINGIRFYTKKTY
jgi:hypothetical protein